MSDPDTHRTTPSDAPQPSAPAADAPRAGSGGPRAHWWHAPRWVNVAILVVASLVVAGVVADHIDLGYYVLTPGVAQPVAPLVKVPAARAHRLHGGVYLTDVYITQVTALTYLYDKVRSDAQLLPAVQVLGPTTPPSQLLDQGYIEMAQSQSAAKAAALTRLGYKVGAHETGVVVFSVVAHSPASGELAVGQVITAVDGHETRNGCTFAQALASKRPGAAVHLTVERSHVTSKAQFAPGPTVHEAVRLGRWPSSVTHPVSTPACPGTGWHGQGFLGVEAQTQQVFRFPFGVGVRTTSIGGPSAGLAMTLGIIDTLWDGNLTGGRTIAATGTIAPTGAVGEVGGVPEKTVAVQRAGATVFFVPAGQVATARSTASPSLEVYGVRSLAGVLRDLRHLGGSVPPTHPRHGS
ncbi:MAG TPA: PDZ domain-containing protein [Acidimicrobiales bacterium]|nr:PDZ domain-containing protein [Acidimicrobiales bacterium]